MTHSNHNKPNPHKPKNHLRADFILSYTDQDIKILNNKKYFNINTYEFDSDNVNGFRHIITEYLESPDFYAKLDIINKTLKSHLRALYSEYYPFDNYNLDVNFKDFILLINPSIANTKWFKKTIITAFDNKFLQYIKFKTKLHIEQHKCKALKKALKIQTRQIKLAYKESLKLIALNILEK